WLDTIYIAVILLQGTYTPLVYAHDGRTQKRMLLLIQTVWAGLVHIVYFVLIRSISLILASIMLKSKEKYTKLLLMSNFHI
ncbi:MAG: hypothetical protein KZQ70_07670, partial [gamma proteobacterium symbiont of Lucinoma myriamae]|nr:hypothetical protein [gamma proteobacterium symbiont of Lucinoma myriamae]MCU7817863.1 hypothetical protein [gamma proteobacterium symbiont of Lucinoma myriamae]MCU7832395.1 hypothetical protein [gamma proteobacterium symbiont of Lucinoma myriamae]